MIYIVQPGKTFYGILQTPNITIPYGEKFGAGIYQEVFYRKRFGNMALPSRESKC